MQETQKKQVQFLGWETPLEEEMSTHASILTWEVPGTEESGGLQSMGSQRVRHNWALSTLASVEWWVWKSSETGLTCERRKRKWRQWGANIFFFPFSFFECGCWEKDRKQLLAFMSFLVQGPIQVSTTVILSPEHSSHFCSYLNQ